MYQDTLEKSLSAGQWQLVNTFVQRVLALLTLLVLARLLTPEAFGVVALLLIIPTFFDGVTTFGFDTSAVQRGNLERYLDQIWTFNVLRGGAIFLIAFFSAPLVADFFHIPYALIGLRFAGSIVFLQSFANIGQTYFTAELNYQKPFYRDLISGVSYSITTVALAFLLHSYWAPFLGNIIAAMCMVAATYLLHPYRPRLNFHWGVLEELRSFTQWLFAQELIQQSALTIQSSLVGHFTSPTDLGLFTKAQSVADAPTSPLISAINKVSFVSYVQVKDSLPHVVEGVNKTFELVVSLAFPYLVAVTLFGTTIVRLVLGSNWLGMAPFLKVLVVEATIDALVVTLAGPVFNAIGEPRTQSINNSVRAGIVIVATFLLVPFFGLWGAVIAALISTSTTAIVVIYYLARHLRMSFDRAAWSACVAAVCCVPPTILARALLGLPFFNTLVGYILVLAICGALYALLLIAEGRLFKKGPYRTLELVAQSVLHHSLNIHSLDFLLLYQQTGEDTIQRV